MLPELIISFDHYNEAEYLLRVETIDTSLASNANFPVPWPAQVPAPATITTTVTNYKVAYKNASGGDKPAIKIRKGQRTALSTMLKTVAHYLEIVANGDAAVLATTGYELRQPIVKSVTQDVLGPLTNFKVSRGVASGTLVVHAKAEPRAAVYHVQTANADPSVEANWSATTEFEHCNRIELTGLTPQKLYYVRLRAFNKNGNGLWVVSPGILVL
jgi:hypothetical protein